MFVPETGLVDAGEECLQKEDCLHGVNRPEFSGGDTLLNDAGDQLHHEQMLFFEEGEAFLEKGVFVFPVVLVDEAQKLESRFVDHHDTPDVALGLMEGDDLGNDRTELLGVSLLCGDDLPDHLHLVVQVATDDLEEDLALAVDVLVKGSLGEAGLPGDIVHGHGRVPFGEENLLGGEKDGAVDLLAAEELPFGSQIVQVCGDGAFVCHGRSRIAPEALVALVSVRILKSSEAKPQSLVMRGIYQGENGLSNRGRKMPKTPWQALLWRF